MLHVLEPPAVLEATVWTRMPERFRRRGLRSSWGQSNRPGLETDSFLEGPVFDDQGRLYVCDIPFGRIFRISPAGDWELIAEWDGEPNGMKFLDAQRLVIADYRNGLMICNLQTGRISAWLERRNSERFKGLNDLIFDAVGNLYFSDQGQTGLHDPTGRLYRLRPDGRLDLVLSNVPSPNGVALSPDGRVLYLAATRANQVWRLPLQEDGSVSKVGAFFTSYGPSGPDGLAVDVSGRLLVANPGLGRVWVLNERGEPERVVVSPTGRSTTNMAFGGSEGKELYITESATGSILRVTLDQAGTRLHQGPAVLR